MKSDMRPFVNHLQAWLERASVVVLNDGIDDAAVIDARRADVVALTAGFVDDASVIEGVRADVIELTPGFVVA